MPLESAHLAPTSTLPVSAHYAETALEAKSLTPHDLMPLDPSALHMLSILECLHQAQVAGRSQVALAVLCKRLALRMSTLQRLMTALSAQSLVHVTEQKERLVASLTAEGHAVAMALQAAA